MSETSDHLVLNGLEVSCIIGDLPEERRREQVLKVDVTLELNLSRAEVSDALADTVDYAKLVSKIDAALREAKCRMIERAAGIVARVCLADPRVQEVHVRIEKRGAVPGLHAAVVEITRQRQENVK